MRRLLVLVLALCAAGLGARGAYACSCVGRPSLREAVAAADVAFSGTVLRRDGDAAYDVRVDAVLKGRVAQAVTLRAESERSSSCGVALAPGPVVYTGGRDLRVNLCSAFWQGGEATAALASSGLATTTPSPAPSPAPSATGDPGAGRDDDRVPWWATGLLVAVVAAVAAGTLARKRATPAADEDLL